MPITSRHHYALSVVPTGPVAELVVRRDGVLIAIGVVDARELSLEDREIDIHASAALVENARNSEPLR